MRRALDDFEALDVAVTEQIVGALDDLRSLMLQLNRLAAAGMDGQGAVADISRRAGLGQPTGDFRPVCGNFNDLRVSEAMTPECPRHDFGDHLSERTRCILANHGLRLSYK